MMADGHTYTGILVGTLQKQMQILQEILSLTKEQTEIAGADSLDEEKLEKSMNAKEILIAKLNELDAGFDAVYERVRIEVRENKELYKEEIKKMQDLIRHCTDLGVEIRVLEDRNKQRFEQLFRNKKKEYGSAKTAAQVASHYQRTMSNTKILDPFFLDKKK